MAGKHLKIVNMGDDVKGVKLLGSRQDPENTYFRVSFPGGDVDIVRTSDDDYWVHVRVNHPEDGSDPNRTVMDARITDARLDLLDRPTAQVDVGDFNNPMLYHLAVRVTRETCPLEKM